MVTWTTGVILGVFGGPDPFWTKQYRPLSFWHQ